MAIQSLTDLKALINSTIQDNTTNDISGSDVQTALINAIDTLDSLEGFINVHKANGQTTITAYGSKALARAAVPDDCKKEGVVIAYKISTGWLIEQNLDATAGTWGDDASWQTIGPVSVSQNTLTIGGSDTVIKQQIVNVNDLNGVLTTTYSDSTTARAAVPVALRLQGQIIKYLLSDGWHMEAYSGTATSYAQWVDFNNWEQLTDKILWENASIDDSGVLSSSTKRVVSSKFKNGNFKISCGSGYDIFIVAYYDSNGTFIEKGSTYPYKSTYETKHYDDITYVRVVVRKSDGTVLSPSDISVTIENLDAKKSELEQAKLDALTPVLYDIFTIKGKAVNKTTGELTVGEGYATTELLPLTKTTKVRVKGQWTESITPIAFYDRKGDYLADGGGSGYISSRIYEVAVANIPSNAEYVRFTRDDTTDAGYVDYSGIELSSITLDAVSLTRQNSEFLEKEFTKYSLTEIQPTSVDDNHYVSPDGTITSNTNYKINKYAVEQGKIYAFSGLFNANINLPFIGYFNSSNVCIKTEYVNTDLSNYISYDGQLLDLPLGTAYIYLNVNKGYSNLFAVKEVVSAETINLPMIDSTVSNKATKIVKNGTDIYVRSHIDDNRDIIISFNENHNNMSTFRTYIGNREDTDLRLLQRHSQIFNDVQAAIGHQYGDYLYAQHGYACPKVTQATSVITSADEGTVWTDPNHDHDYIYGDTTYQSKYTIGKVDGNDIYLLPVINGTEGYETRGWINGNSYYPESLVSDADQSRSVNVSNGEVYDLPVQTSVRLSFLADGADVEDGTTYCNELKIIEELIGWNPFDVTTWWPEPVYNTEMVRITRTHTLVGSTMSVNVALNFKRKFWIDNYYCCIPQSMLYDQGYNCYTVIPKAIKASYDVGGAIYYKENIDKPFLANSMLEPTLYIHRNAEELKNANEFTDRVISLAKSTDDSKFKFGFASGFSLFEGLTVNEYRLQNVAEGSGAVNIVQSFDPSLSNKCYFRLLKPLGFSGEPNYGRIPENWVGTFSCYYSWFGVDDTLNDIQCFTYKTGNTYVVYIHSQEAHTNAFVGMPSYLEGLTVKETIERSTENVNLKSTTVIGGGLYVDFPYSANYIVVKLQ